MVSFRSVVAILIALLFASINSAYAADTPAMLPRGGAMPATNVAKPAGGANAWAAKRVFAHYMVCCPTVGGSATLDDYKREIEEAQRRGIDGFALNCGNWEKREPHYKARTLLMYEAAKQLGTGFELFISLDGEAMAELHDVVRTLKNHPNQFRHDGRPVLSTFGGQGGDDHAGGRNLIRAAHDGGTFFVPYYYPRPNITELPTEAHVAQLIRDFPDMDGYFYFGGAGNGEQIAQCNTIHAKAWLDLGKVFMAGITPYYRANGGNFRCFETRGFEGMSREWESAIRSGATWVELVTWNDWNESSYLSPFGEPADTSLWKGHFGPKMLSHVAYLDASRHYMEWFKTGSPPTIVDDKLFYFYRLHPASVPVTVNAADESKGRGRPKGADALLDHVFVTTFLTAPAQLTLHSGATSKNFDLPTGVHHVSMPFAPGAQRFVLQRNGASIFDKTGEHEISATDGASRFNTFSGSASR
jgi:glucan endo-1,3-alpha-glucosidase